MANVVKLQNKKIKNDSESLWQYYLEVQSNVRSLDALGFDTTSLGAPMIIVFLDKMPRDMQLMWTRDKTRSATNLKEG